MSLVFWICLITAFCGKANTLTQYVCPCYDVLLNCYPSFVSVNKISSSMKNGNCNKDYQCGNSRCCSRRLNDSLVPITERCLNVLNTCLHSTSCNISYNSLAIAVEDCHDHQQAPYIEVDYECISGSSATVMETAISVNTTPSVGSSIVVKETSTSVNTPPSVGTYEGRNSLPTIIGVVIAAIIVIVVVSVALIIFRRRQKKRRKDDTHISDVPKGLINHTYESSLETGESKATVEASNYDIINDESVPTLFLPNKKKKDTTSIRESAKKYGNVSDEEYDRIELEKKVANQASNYDRLPSLKGKIEDDPYSHLSNGSKSVTTAMATANDYSHCKLNSDDTLRNGHDYSHVNVTEDCWKNPEPDINEDDSYNHIHFDDTKHPMRNGTAVNGDNKSKSEKDSPTCIDDKARDVEGENYPLNKEDTEVSLRNAQHQRKSVSLMDNNTEMAPRSKDQQYTAVVKVKNAKGSNGIDSVAEENEDSKIPNELFNTPINPD